MPDEIRINRSQSQAPAAQPARQEPSMPMEMESSGKSSKMPWVILGLLVIVLVVLGVLFRGSLFKGAPANKAPSSGETSGYQAVFLTNGQVYFGKINGPSKDYVTLNDIYYLQVGPTQGSGATSTPNQEVHLVKLGQELHGPVDEMHISRSQILFYEDLKSSGSVVTAILKDKAGAAPTTPAK